MKSPATTLQGRGAAALCVVLLGILSAVAPGRAQDELTAELKPGIPPFPPLERDNLVSPRYASIDPVAPITEAYFVTGTRPDGEDYLAALLRHPEGATFSTLSADRSEDGDLTGSCEFRDLGPERLAMRLDWRLAADRSRVTYSWHRIESAVYVGQMAPDLSFRFLDGSSGSVAAARGRVLVLNWWAVYCVPCVQEMPALNQIVADFASEPAVSFVALSPEEERGILEPFLGRKRFDYRQALADKTVRAYFGEAFPRHLVIDRTGRVTFDQGGGSTMEPVGLRAAIRAALEAPPQERAGG